MGVQKGRRATTDKHKRCLAYVRAVNKKAWTTGLLETRLKRVVVDNRKRVANIRLTVTLGDVMLEKTSLLCLENAFILSDNKK